LESWAALVFSVTNYWDCTSLSFTCHESLFQFTRGKRRRCVWLGMKDSRMMLYLEALSSDVVPG